jgi:hypothetical protein
MKSAAKVLIEPFCVPCTVGVKVTVMVQLDFPKMLLPQVLICANGPLEAIVPMATGFAVKFLTVIVIG